MVLRVFWLLLHAVSVPRASRILCSWETLAILVRAPWTALVSDAGALHLEVHG